MKKTALFTVLLALLSLLVLNTGCKKTPVIQEEIVLRVGSSKAYKTTNRFADYWYGVLTNITTHDSLIKLGSDMQPKPWLATSWEVSQDAKTFTFTIAQNAKWHDGTALTAEDVKFSIEYYRDLDAGSAWMKDVINTVTVDSNKVTLALKKPYGNLLTEFETYSIIPKHIWTTVAEPLKYEGTDRTLGSGPFIFESWDTTAGKFIFKANPDYFQGKPAIDQLEVNVFSNMDALVMSLAKGDIDTWWD
ncbi:MAG: ABC transporter substrate-binding protein, partial [Chloroflexi bacterium]|nr:ABC transporter substrate-binding protein [Chloroflexota bacterium]